MKDDDVQDEVESLSRALKTTGNFRTSWAPLVISDLLNDKVEEVLKKLQRRRRRVEIRERSHFNEEPFSMTITGYQSILDVDKPGRLAQIYWFSKDTGYDVIIKTDTDTESFSWDDLLRRSTQDMYITAMHPSGQPNTYVVKFAGGGGGLGGGGRWSWDNHMEIGISTDKEVNLNNINYTYFTRHRVRV